MADLPTRSIIRDEAFEDELRLLIPDAVRADEYTSAAETLLAWEPTSGVPVPGVADLWTLPMAPLDGRTIWLLYTFDSATVVLIGLRAA